MSSRVIDEVVERLEALPLNVQEQVLQIVRDLDASQLKGVSGKQLLKFAGMIDEADLQLMSRAIETGCEQVNPDEW